MRFSMMIGSIYRQMLKYNFSISNVGNSLIRYRFWETPTFFSFCIRIICCYLQKIQLSNRRDYVMDCTHSFF